MLKTLFGKSPEYVGKIKDTLEARHFETTEVRYNYNVKIARTFKCLTPLLAFYMLHNCIRIYAPVY